jgi:hypothetical protein
VVVNQEENATKNLLKVFNTKYKQNFKVIQTMGKYWVIEIGVAKKVYFARTLDWRGIEVTKTFSFKE